MSEKVTLIIKAANQSVDDQKIECELEHTILHVKQEISRTHPGTPSVGEQRLIYSGQLLQDSLTLKTVLRHPTENNSYTIHLVCSTPRQKSNDRSPEHSRQTSSQSSSNQSSIVTDRNRSTPQSPIESLTDGLRHRFVSSGESTSHDISQPGVPLNQSTVYPHFAQAAPQLQLGGDPMQQFVVMQQMYAQYMASYMQYLQSGSLESSRQQQEGNHSILSSPPLVLSPNANVDVSNQQNRQPQANLEQLQNNIADQQARPNAQLRMNAPGGIAEEEEDGPPRDWLDYIYFASRMAILLCVVYFYSTLTRFIVVIISCLVMYMYQAGWARALMRVGAENDPPLPPVPEEENRLRNREENIERNREEEENRQINQDDDVIEEQRRNDAGPAANDAARPRTQDRTNGSLGEKGEMRESDEEEEEEEESRDFQGGEAVQNVVEGQPSTEQRPIMEDLPPQPSLLALSWTFLTTFFTSLIPDQHQIV